MEGIDLKRQKYLTEFGAKEIAEHPAQLFIGVYPQQYDADIPSYAISMIKGTGINNKGQVVGDSLIQLQGNTGWDTREKALKVLREILEEAITLSADQLRDSKYQTLSMDMIDKIIAYYKQDEAEPWKSVANILGVIDEGMPVKMHS